ncbi:MAG: uracil-DNA glycosylase [Thermoleophilia bacterium]|nr:uracil-DNA glycosylase [Thermoleophilia bacterium]
MASGPSRRERLIELLEQVRECRRCPLGDTRNKAVFGSGSVDAPIMFVGEAPGYHEDQQGLPFVGQAGRLLETLLARIGLTRKDVFISNILKCRPPDNRDPLPDEISLCRGFLERQIDIIQPRVICTMGNFSTKLLSGRNDGITRVRGRVQPMPSRDAVQIFPVFHPAAALYTPSNLSLLEKDFDDMGEVIGEVASAGVSPAPDTKGDERAGSAFAAVDAETPGSESDFEVSVIEDRKRRVLDEAGQEGPPPVPGVQDPEQLGLF